MNRIEIIQGLINKYNYKSYLEVGVQSGHCFTAIKCDKKVGVDPDKSSAATVHLTSDDFFSQNKDKFDIFFCDGLHHSQQVETDLNNMLSCMNDGGIIVMHDCLPTNEFMQLIPLTTQCEWTGDCWKAFVKLRQTRDDLFMATVNCDWGCGIIKVGSQKKLNVEVELTYQNFEKNKQEWMNIISPEQFAISFL